MGDVPDGRRGEGGTMDIAASPDNAAGTKGTVGVTKRKPARALAPGPAPG
jgi:hypothetical protein